MLPSIRRKGNLKRLLKRAKKLPMLVERTEKRYNDKKKRKRKTTGEKKKPENANRHILNTLNTSGRRCSPYLNHWSRSTASLLIAVITQEPVRSTRKFQGKKNETKTKEEKKDVYCGCERVTTSEFCNSLSLLFPSQKKQRRKKKKKINKNWFINLLSIDKRSNIHDSLVNHFLLLRPLGFA